MFHDTEKQPMARRVLPDGQREPDECRGGSLDSRGFRLSQHPERIHECGPGVATRSLPCWSLMSAVRTRRSCFGLVLTAGLTVLGSSCRGHVEQTLGDSEGRSFLARCTAERVCTLTQKSGPTSDVAGGAKVPGRMELRNTGRLVGVCGPFHGDAPNPTDCRPIVCKAEANCPPADGLTTGVCIDGLCTEPSHAINSDDAVMLCLAKTGLGRQSPLQIERLALGLNCGNPCRIPKPCQQL